MHKLIELKEKLMNELKDYADNGKFSKDDVEAIKYTASAIDHICNIVEDVDGYSNAYEGQGGGSYAYARGGNRGGGRSNSRSYARGRGRNARRDSMGRYSNEGYSMADGIAEELMDLMQEAPDQQTRQDIQRIVSRLEQM